MPDGTYYDRELETRSWEQIQQMTFAKAQSQIERAYEKSSYYRRKYDEVGVTPSDIRTPADLARVPFFEKGEERTSPAGGATPRWAPVSGARPGGPRARFVRHDRYAHILRDDRQRPAHLGRDHG
jgi:hypothetical protein